jgi:hypothetical protein
MEWGEIPPGKAESMFLLPAPPARKTKVKAVAVSVASVFLPETSPEVLRVH